MLYFLTLLIDLIHNVPLVLCQELTNYCYPLYIIIFEILDVASSGDLPTWVVMCTNYNGGPDQHFRLVYVGIRTSFGHTVTLLNLHFLSQKPEWSRSLWFSQHICRTGTSVRVLPRGYPLVPTLWGLRHSSDISQCHSLLQKHGKSLSTIHGLYVK